MANLMEENLLSLECNMLHSELEPNQSVIVKLKYNSLGGKVAQLLEYQKSIGIILDNMPCTFDRIESACIQYLAGGRAMLNRAVLSRQQIQDCEVRYLKNKHVRTVLLAVAKDLNISLKHAYELSSWISFDQLCSNGWSGNIRNYHAGLVLLAKMRLMIYISWRLLKPSLLHVCIEFPNGFCWAVNMVRQAESVLKQAVGEDVLLSIQDLVNQMPREDTTFEIGYPYLKNLFGGLHQIFTSFGIVENSRLLFSSDLNSHTPGPKPHEKTYTVSEFQVYTQDGITYEDWNRMLEQTLVRGPFSVAVRWFDSYSYRLKEDVVLQPTPLDVFSYKSLERNDYHMLLMTGFGVDGSGEQYWELQDCACTDINRGDRGFLRFSRAANLVTHFVSMG